LLSEIPAAASEAAALVSDDAAAVSELAAANADAAAALASVEAELAELLADVADVAAEVAEEAAAVADASASAALVDATEASLAASVVASPDPPAPLHIAMLLPYLLAIYIVTSKPNRNSVYSGLDHIVFPYEKLPKPCEPGELLTNLELSWNS
jgi:hypothetical protein